jgi:diaminopimelate epimerase
MEALGNDFMLVDARQHPFEPAPALVREWADRHRGVGFDQLLILRPTDQAGHHCGVEIRNGDGSTAEQCGNGMRAVALWLSQEDGLEGRIRLATTAGTVEARCRQSGEISATLGVPSFSPASIGLSGCEAFPCSFRVGDEALTVHGASMGNPHLLVIEPDPPDSERLLEIGETLGHHPDLARGANVGLAWIESRHRIRLRVYERGVGPTRACGSGASAAAAILLDLGRVDNPVEVVQPGGTLVVNWPGEGQAVATAGPARRVFEGVLPCRIEAA